MKEKDFFLTVIDQLKKELKQVLPGEEAQFAMAPYLKNLRKTALAENPAPKLGAVLILIYPFNKQPHTLLMLRNAYNGVHSAQMSFPGGKKDETDPTLEATALRETEEETGIRTKSVKILGKLSQVYIPPSGFLVQPYIGYLPERPQLKPDKKEVKELIETPLHLIINDKTIETKNIKLHNGLIINNTPYFNIFGHTVWGATAMMLGEFKMILKRVFNEI